MIHKSKNTAMYFTSLEIENVKCFGTKQILDLTNEKGQISSWTLILGENGVGKTTLLKCLAWMVPVEEPDREIKNEAKISKVAIKPFMDNFENDSDYEQLSKEGQNIKSRIRATFANSSKLGAVPNKRSIVSHGVNFQVVDGKLKKYDPEFGELTKFNSPNLFAYNAGRHMALRNYDKSELLDPVSNLFSESGDLYDAEQVLSNLEYASLKEKGRGKSTLLLNKVKQILVDLLPDLHGTDCVLINSPINSDGTKNETLVEVITPYGKVPLNALSLGYKTMLAWSVDLAIRMLWLNPESPSPLNEPAVVIIDEIDLHLHPKWQRTVRDYLTKHFPYVQFICTAHSPFMAQVSEKENLCVLSQNGNEVSIENTPFLVHGWRIGQIITSDLFGVPSERSPEIEKSINRRRALLDKMSLTIEEKQELYQLDEDLSGIPVKINESEEDLKLFNKLQRMSKILTNKKQAPND
ncbi:MAG: AAA family ATPase [Saprospiraceae bacterium]